MLKQIITLTLATSVSSLAFSDTIGFRIGANSWQQNYSGTIQSDPSDIIDINTDLGLNDDTNNNFYFVFEHPIPVLPNVLLQRTELEISGTGNLTKTFDGVTYTGAVKTDLDLSHTDLTLYYEILDNWVSVDVGLTIRTFDEGITITDGINASSENLDETLPLLYVASKFELPLTGLYVGADINALSYDDNKLLDYKLNIGYESKLGLIVELGYRSFELDYEDNIDEKADITIDGGYFGVAYHF